MKRTLAALALAFAAVLGTSLPAMAHDTLTGSDPPQGAKLASGPARVSFTFGEPVQNSAGFNEITVTGPGDTHWATGAVTVAGDTLSAPLGPLGPAGTYTIGYRIVSADGHPTSGQITVTLTTAGAGKPLVATSTPADGASGGGLPAWVWLAVAVLAIGLALLIAARRRRTRGA